MILKKVEKQEEKLSIQNAKNLYEYKIHEIRCTKLLCQRRENTASYFTNLWLTSVNNSFPDGSLFTFSLTKAALSSAQHQNDSKLTYSNLFLYPSYTKPHHVSYSIYNVTVNNMSIYQLSLSVARAPPHPGDHVWGLWQVSGLVSSSAESSPRRHRLPAAAATNQSHTHTQPEQSTKKHMHSTHHSLGRGTNEAATMNPLFEMLDRGKGAGPIYCPTYEHTVLLQYRPIIIIIIIIMCSIRNP